MKKVLIITQDNEYVNRILQRISNERYDISHAIDGTDALIKMEDCHYDVAIVDLSNDENEQSVLAALSKQYPTTIRVSVSEVNANFEHYMPKKMNHTQFQCSKNINIDELFNLIDKVIEIDGKVKNRKLINLMSNLKHLPTIPHVYFELSAMIMDNASIEEIAHKLEGDPAITSNILKMANTAFYNAKTGSIRQAIMYIGLINVKNIILTNAVFGNDGLDPKTRDIHWEHVGLTNKLLNAFYFELLGKKLNNNISSVGLLHDIGSVVLMSNYPVEFNQIVKEVNENRALRFRTLEKERIGFAHEELGGYLLDLWGLPYPIIEAALCHHDPLNPSIINQELVMAVHLCNYYAWEAMTVKKYDNYLEEAVFPILGITKHRFEMFFEAIMKKK